jgi:hypothetical protein
MVGAGHADRDRAVERGHGLQDGLVRRGTGREAPRDERRDDLRVGRDLLRDREARLALSSA